MAEHNHVTRDIKPPGQCPGCDRFHNDGCLCLVEDGVIVRTDDLCPLHSKRPLEKKK